MERVHTLSFIVKWENQIDIFLFRLNGQKKKFIFQLFREQKDNLKILPTRNITCEESEIVMWLIGFWLHLIFITHETKRSWVKLFDKRQKEHYWLNLTELMKMTATQGQWKVNDHQQNNTFSIYACHQDQGHHNYDHQTLKSDYDHERRNWGGVRARFKRKQCIRLHAMQCAAVQCCAMQCDVVQNIALGCTQCSAL